MAHRTSSTNVGLPEVYRFGCTLSMMSLELSRLWKQTSLSAVRVRLVVGAVAESRQRQLGEHAIAAITWMEAVRRVVRRLIEPRIAHEIHHQHALRGEGVHAIGQADRHPLNQALVGGW